MIESLSIIAPSVFAFYMVVATNFLPEIIGCRMQHILKNSMLAKHIMAMILLFFLVVYVNPTNSDKKMVYNISLTLMIYAWFFMTTRSPFIIAVVSILLLLVVYILSTRKDRLKSENKKDEADVVEKVQNYLMVIAIVISTFGFVLYVLEKKAEYGKRFRIDKFLLGKLTCANYTTPRAKIL